jgi:hypothetical protein
MSSQQNDSQMEGVQNPVSEAKGRSKPARLKNGQQSETRRENFVGSMSGSLGSVETGDGQERMLTVKECFQEKECRRPLTKEEYFQWNGVGTIGLGPDGTIIVGDEDGMYILASELPEELSADLIGNVVRFMPETPTKPKAEDFWSSQLHKTKQSNKGLLVEVMTMTPARPKEPQVTKAEL